jgi:hypothetical protein
LDGWQFTPSVELEIARREGVDAQFPSRFEVKMNKREENSIYSVVSLGLEKEGGIKACLGRTALEDETAVSCRAPLKRAPLADRVGVFGDSFPRVSHNTDPIFSARTGRDL